MKDLQELVSHKRVRSADRANMKHLLQQLKHGRPLSYQERLNLQAYLSRYRTFLARDSQNAQDRGIE